MGGGSCGGDGVVGQILAFEVDPDPGVPLGFRDRLAGENGWSRGFAARVYAEYRRFLVLAATTGQATPSDAVDQVWHLHLAYTRSYWDHLCGEVLGFPLHHGPTTGTQADGAHHRAQYADTLARYREVFGEEPPADIWPGVGEQFRDPARWRRVDTRSYLTVRRAPLVAGGAAALLVAGSTAAAARTDSDRHGLVLLGVAVAVVSVIVVAVIVATRSASGASPRRRGWGDGGFFIWGGDGGDSGGSDHDSSGGGDSGGGGCGSSGGDGGGCGSG
ncbi:MAG TPA: hypothetical protein VGO60_06540 [Iamia sp.]|jgi:hypothetical protein|nr:hypothetical protein [Iamia sp.]